MEKLLGYCFNEEGRYDKPVTLEGEQEVMGFIENHKNSYPRIMITDILDRCVFEARNGEAVFPSKEMVQSQEKYNVTIYQLKPMSDKKLIFSDAEELENMGLTVQADNYNRVWSGELDTNNLEEIYEMFNIEHPDDFKGHSMSISDILQVNDDFYFVDSIGFKKIAFNTENVEDLKYESNEEKMKVLIVEPHKEPYVSEIGKGLKAMQDIVGGLIECVYLDDECIAVINEEGKLIGLEGNRRLGSTDIIAGTFFIVGDAGEEFCSLTDEQAEKYLEYFNEPVQIESQEVEDSIHIEFYEF